MMSEATLDALATALNIALDMLRKTSPRALDRALDFVTDDADAALPQEPLKLLVGHVRDCGPNDPILHALTPAIQAWDHSNAPWTGQTTPHSSERRHLVLQRLGFDDVDHETINSRILLLDERSLPIVIAEKHEEWYENRKRSIREFYWNAYKNQLLPPRGKWSHEAVSNLDVSIDDVVARLSDPTRNVIYPVKGLVMGYVQSGKTSHFSGLITKAVDAGYRLVIVLGGTLDLLRQQTQRRIDKEIVGVELLEREEYGRDVDWSQFVSHGGMPSQLGAFDWERLTNRDDDYKQLSRQLGVLEFRSADRNKPFNHPDNLRVASAKIAVIKKVPARLNKLCSDLEKLGELRNRLEQVPTLVIDDESDQASINTVDQAKRQGHRTGTNKAIVRLLSLLPRAQYVGYTATPFANVFVDPEDAADLFPKDFIVSLPRPDGYMGVTDFFDFGDVVQPDDYRGNQNAFVRPVDGDNELAANLPKAIDSFVLSGALKLYREAKKPERFRFQHHTMLVHHSSAQIAHEADREVVARIFRNGARYQTQAGLKALSVLFDKDFAPVSRVRASDDPFPASFDELKPFISACLSRLTRDQAVRIVNGDERNRDDTPDFDAGPVWAILVGGTKLSRGYTVEGLTVSYYRRPAGAGDTLMQMGRWFGFRDGYRDLVRLFLGRHEKRGRTTIDLYEAFRSVCLDEEALRADLRKYSNEGITPRQVPPLVRQHLPQLPPTSRNKMFNAEIRSQDFAGQWTEKTSAPTSSVLVGANRKSIATLLSHARLGSSEKVSFGSPGGPQRSFDAYISDVAGEDVLTFLREYRWADGRESVALEINYIASMMAAGSLTDWYVMLPQASTGDSVSLAASGTPKLAVIRRSRVSETRFGVYSEPRHRDAAAALAGRLQVENPSSALKSRSAARRPVLLVYLVRGPGDIGNNVSVGFGIQYPGEKRDRAIQWSVRDASNADSIVVSVASSKRKPRKP